MNAVLLCAGKGTRLYPFTVHHPKPLLKVDGKPLVERTIELLKKNNVDEIVVVTGYKAEQFDYLKEKYGVVLCHNKDYETKNNKSSLLVAKKYLKDSLIIDGDLFFVRDIFNLMTFECTQMLCQKTKGHEWEVIVDSENHLVDVIKNSSSGFCLSSVSFIKNEDVPNLISELFRGSDEEYWEDAALRMCRYCPIEVIKSNSEFHIELDSFREALDRGVMTPEQIAVQCDEYGFVEQLKGLTNNSFKITLDGQQSVLRIPGKNTSSMVDRSLEPLIVNFINKHSEITPQSIYWGDGFKVTRFLSGYETLDRETLTDEQIIQVAKLLRELHSLPIEGLDNCVLTVNSEMELYERLAKMDLLDDEERVNFSSWSRMFDSEDQVLCHRDLLLDNLMFDNKAKHLQVIDFEYAGICNKYWDLVSFILEAELSEKEEDTFLQAYGTIDLKKIAQMKILVDYIWGLWGFVKGYRCYGRTRIARMQDQIMVTGL